MTYKLMVQGTTSDAGKSTLVAALCRILARRNARVAPFKPQNMALNSAVTEDGGEIGRAQALQAQAAGIAPTTDMNPVLLKPNSDTGAQVIIHGKAVGNKEAGVYHDFKPLAWEAVLASWHRLCECYDHVLVEGAGSPAEINLRDGDIANMGFAEGVDCPVILIADIDKGGVFAHICGTMELLSETEQQRVVGFVINRFRGDIRLLQSGLDWLEARTGKPVLAVLPYLKGFHLDAEDAVTTVTSRRDGGRGQHLKVCVAVLPRISNHTDFDALQVHPQVELTFVGPDQPLPPTDLIILPGSKSVIADLAFLRAQGWEERIQRHLRYGGKLLGICGGFQMLGQGIYDPLQLEGQTTEAPGLGYLHIETELAQEKQLRNRQGRLTLANAQVSGYEIHSGCSFGKGLEHPLVRFTDVDCESAPVQDGARSADDQIIGTYLHGLFDQPEALSAILTWAGLEEDEAFDYGRYREAAIDRLADCVDEAMDWERLNEALGAFQQRRTVE